MHLRKAHYMCGWDWGACLPDGGIFRPVTLLGIEQAQKRVEELSNQAIDLLHQLSGENEYLEQLLIQLIHRDR